MRTPCSALVLALVLLAGCSPSAPPSPSPRPTTAITAQVLGQILDEHAPGAFAIAGGDGVLSANQPTEFVRGIEATAYHLAAQRVATGTSPVADILHASSRQWLRLSPSSLDIQMVEPGLLDRALGGGAP